MLQMIVESIECWEVVKNEGKSFFFHMKKTKQKINRSCGSIFTTMMMMCEEIFGDREQKGRILKGRIPNGQILKGRINVNRSNTKRLNIRKSNENRN